jgi:hypothetical protein
MGQPVDLVEADEGNTKIIDHRRRRFSDGGPF